MALVGLAAAVSVRAGALGLTHDELGLACLAGGQHGDLDGFACCLEISGDGEQVLGGAGHGVFPLV